MIAAMYYGSLTAVEILRRDTLVGKSPRLPSRNSIFAPIVELTGFHRDDAPQSKNLKPGQFIVNNNNFQTGYATLTSFL